MEAENEFPAIVTGGGCKRRGRGEKVHVCIRKRGAHVGSCFYGQDLGTWGGEGHGRATGDW